MTGTTQRIARRFLDLGGRLMVHPNGQPTAGLNAAAILSLDLTQRQRAKVRRINRALDAALDRRGADLLTLIRAKGTALASGWTVWEARA